MHLLKVHIIWLTLLLICPLAFLHANGFRYDLPQEVAQKITEGADCLEKQAPSCNSFFQTAIDIANNLDQDSVLAMTLFEVGKRLQLYGSLDERMRYVRTGTQLNGADHPSVTNRLFRALAQSYQEAKMLDSIIPAYQKAMQWAKESNDSRMIAITYIQWAEGLNQMGKTKDAIELLLEGEEYALNSGDRHRVGGIAITLGNIYVQNQDYQKGLEKYDDAVNIFREIKDSMMYFGTMINRANVSLSINEPGYALENLPKAIDFFAKKDLSSLIIAQAKYGNALYEVEEWEKAREVLTRNLELCRKQGNVRIGVITQLSLIQCHLKLGSSNKALQLAKDLWTAEKERGMSNTYLKSLDFYAESLIANQNFEEALSIRREASILRDSLYTLEKMKEIAALQEQYEAEKREKEILFLEEEVKSSQLQNALLWTSAVFLIALIGLIVFYFRERGKRFVMEKQKLTDKLDYQKRTLTTHILHIARKNETLIELKEKLLALQKETSHSSGQQLVNTINLSLQDEDNWQKFTQHFEEVHTDFNRNIQEAYPDITANELRLLALLKINLSSKEIANILNITPGGVKKARHRLRKKLNLTIEESLEKFVHKF